MPKTFTESVFSSTYKDDFIDSDNYHRILFNSGRALQARELTQLQTIIQEEIARFGRNIFKEGASVNPGELLSLVIMSSSKLHLQTFLQIHQL